MSKVTVFYDTHFTETYENVDEVAMTKSYWTIVRAKDQDTTVTFIPERAVQKVEIVGPTDEGYKPDLKVVPFERGEEGA